MKKSILFLFLFTIITLEVKSQDLLITGKVTSEEEINLVGATIEVNQINGTVTNEEGAFGIKVKNSDQGIDLKVRMIGHETLDTIIKTELSKIHLVFKLKETFYDQPELVVSGKKTTNIFNKNDWIVLDSKIHNDLLCLIYIEANKRYFGLAKLNGTLINRQKLDEKYSQLKESCTGAMCLIAKNEYVLKVTGNSFSKAMQNTIKKSATSLTMKLKNQN